MPTCTLIVAAYPAVRAGLAALLRETEGVCVQGELADNADTLSRMLPGLTPDAVLYDMAGSDALTSVLSAIGRSEPAPALLVLGDTPERDLPRLQGASGLVGWGYLPRNAEPDQLSAALRAVATGLIVTQTSPTQSKTAQSATDPLLTARESEVLQLMALGLPNKLIAHRLGITLHTAKFHVAQILSKLGAASRTEAVTLGARQGMVAL